MQEALEINSRKRRDRLHIIADILDIAMNGSLKTQIMYRANLSFAQVNEYLPLLIEVNLITPIMQNDRKAYKVAPKGMRFLQSYAKIKDLLKTDEEREGKNNSLNYFKDGNSYKTKE